MKSETYSSCHFSCYDFHLCGQKQIQTHFEFTFHCLYSWAQLRVSFRHSRETCGLFLLLWLQFSHPITSIEPWIPQGSLLLGLCVNIHHDGLYIQNLNCLYLFTCCRTLRDLPCKPPGGVLLHTESWVEVNEARLYSKVVPNADKTISTLPAAYFPHRSSYNAEHTSKTQGSGPLKLTKWLLWAAKCSEVKFDGCLNTLSSDLRFVLRWDTNWRR